MNWAELSGMQQAQIRWLTQVLQERESRHQVIRGYPNSFHVSIEKGTDQ